MPLDKKHSIEHLESPYGTLDDASTSYSHDSDYSQELAHYAKLATEFEHNLTFTEAVKYYKKAILWSICLSTGIIMEAFDSILITSFFGFPSFTKKFGSPMPNGTYEISSHWQMLLGGSPFIGLLIGTLMNGVLAEKYGHRKVIMMSLIIMTLFIFISFYATSIQMLLVGQILCGIPWGVFATIGPTYSSEICPTALRGYLTSYVNLCWTLGQCLAATVLSLLVNNETEWGYRIPLAVQWAWPLPLFILTYLAPESPWWLVRNDDPKRALESIKLLTDPEIHNKASWILSMIIHTNSMEQESDGSVSITNPESVFSSTRSKSNSISRNSLGSDSMMDNATAIPGMSSHSRSNSMSSSSTKLITRTALSDSNFNFPMLTSRGSRFKRFFEGGVDFLGFKSYKECFKSINARRTEISIITMAGQTTCGAIFAYSPSYFFRQIDISADVTYKLNFIATLFSILGTTGSWLLLNKYGRREIYLAGLNVLSILLLMIGFLEVYSDTNPNIKWYQCFLTMIWIFCYSLSIGPVTFTIVAEMSSTKLRSQTMAIARGTYNIIQVLCLLLEVEIINPQNLDLKGYSGLVWFVPCSLTLFWAFFRLPETGNRTYGELDVLFEHKVPARHFATCNVRQIDS